jgi:chromodomain-helicase-DNA-binding protein 4/chromodomain-helicase-DNA-binding protein 5
MEGSQVIEATCTSKSDAPDKSSKSHGSSIKDAPETEARLPESDNSAPLAPELPVMGDVPGTSSSRAADTPVPSDDIDLKQKNPLDNARITVNIEEPMEKPAPLEETKDLDASHPVSVQTVNEDIVDEITSDEH